MAKQWHWGSFGKAMTAAIVLQLDDAGSLDINDAIGQYLDTDTIPFLDSTTTIKMLLNHTTGLSNSWSNGTNLWTDVWGDRDSVWNLNDVLSYRTAGTPNPSLNHNYNGYDNYLMLGFLIEAITGNSLEAEYNSRLFTPLGFTNSSMGTNGVNMNNLNGVYAGSQYRGNLAHNSYMSTRGGGGAYMGSSKDATKFVRAFHSDQLVSASLMTEARTSTLGTPTTIPNTCAGTLEQTYGYGTNIVHLINAQNDTVSMYGHGGNGLGNVLAFYSIEEDISIVIATNDFEPAGQQGVFALFMDLTCYLWNNLPTLRCAEYVGLKEMNLSEFQLFPNPASDVLRIESHIIPQRVAILDFSGTTIAEFKNQIEFDVSALSQGMYLIKAQFEGEEITKVWVKE